MRSSRLYSEDSEEVAANLRPNRGPTKSRTGKIKAVPHKDQGSSAESDDDQLGVSALKAGNFADLNDSLYLKSGESSNVRVVNRQRPSSLLRPGNNVVKPAGFVPRDLKGGERASAEFKPKNIRVAVGSSNRDEDRRGQKQSNDRDDSDKLPDSWSRAPKKFLEEVEDDRAHHSSAPTTKSKDWNTAKSSSQQPYHEEEDDRQKPTSRARQSQNKYQSRREGEDDQSDVVSQSSADTVEDYEKDRRGGGARHQHHEEEEEEYGFKPRKKITQPIHEYNPSKRNPKQPEPDFSEEEVEEAPPRRVATGKTKNTNNTNNRFKDAFRQSAEEEEEAAFMAYANQKERNGALLPRKSGRYDDYDGTGYSGGQHSIPGGNRGSRDLYNAAHVDNDDDDNNEDDHRGGGRTSYTGKGNKYAANRQKDWEEEEEDVNEEDDHRKRRDRDHHRDEEVENNYNRLQSANYQYRNPPAATGNVKKPTPALHRERSGSGSGGWFSAFTSSGKNSNKDNNKDNNSSSHNDTNHNNNNNSKRSYSPPGTGANTAALVNAYNNMAGNHSFVIIAHPHGIKSRMVQCTIIRDRTSMHGKLYPTYELILEEPRKTLIIARKMSMNRTSNYHLFDMTRGSVTSSHKLSKKAGNYLGKLRAKNMQRTGYSLVTAKDEEQREEIAGILFDRITFMDQLNDGNQPRKMKILLPLLNEDSIPIPLITANTYGFESLPEMLQLIEENKLTLPNDLRLLHTKEPVFEHGNYRLNFHGRVTQPSVKNFQIVPHDDINDVRCQFGKVSKDEFHLDYKEPFNAVQAFALALAQFNL